MLFSCVFKLQCSARIVAKILKVNLSKLATNKILSLWNNNTWWQANEVG